MTTEAELDGLLDNPEFSALVNLSSWSLYEPINMANRHALLQQLVFEEVIIRREGNLKALRRGLGTLEWPVLLAKHTDLLKPFFVTGELKAITVEQVKNAISSPWPACPKQARAYDHFMDLISHFEGVYYCMQSIGMYHLNLKPIIILAFPASMPLCKVAMSPHL